MIAYVTGFLFCADRRHVVLIEKQAPAWQRGLLNGVGGKIEPGETANAAMSREFVEEAGVEIAPERWRPFAVIERPSHYHVTFFQAFGDEAFQARTVEREAVVLHEIAALPAAVIPNLRWLIPMALDEKLCFEKPVRVLERE